MRKSDYKNPYMFDKVRPIYVYRALLYLLDQELFKEQGILVSHTWELNNLNNGNNLKNFIVESDDEFAFLEEPKKTNSKTNRKCSDETSILKKNDKERESDSKIDQHVCSQTLLDREIKVASCDSGFSVSLLFDKYSEELTFLKIYGGNKLTYPSSLSYESICRSELLRYDRRCAENVTKIFYSYKKLLAIRLLDSIKISLKNTKNIQSLQSSLILNDEKINEFQHSVESNMFLARIKSSPQFWSKIKLD